jgi:hypothetical protein
VEVLAPHHLHIKTKQRQFADSFRRIDVKFHKTPNSSPLLLANKSDLQRRGTLSGGAQVELWSFNYNSTTGGAQESFLPVAKTEAGIFVFQVGFQDTYAVLNAGIQFELNAGVTVRFWGIEPWMRRLLVDVYGEFEMEINPAMRVDGTTVQPLTKGTVDLEREKTFGPVPGPKITILIAGVPLTISSKLGLKLGASLEFQGDAVVSLPCSYRQELHFGLSCRLTSRNALPKWYLESLTISR